MTKNSLIIVGSGIKFMSHLTVEAKACIEKSDKVLYLVNEPLIEEWIQKNNSNAESLFHLYTQLSQRNENYELIAEYIFQHVKKFKNLCVVMYGHPTVFVQPSLYAAKKAMDEGHEVTILPGISTEACLYADLLIDPGSCGCQSFEATDFLLYKREFDSSSHLILYQPYMIGVLGIPINHDPRQGLELLKEFLNQKYDLEHEIVLYEASQYPAFKSKMNKITLKDLPESEMSVLTTLYIKPNKEKQHDPQVLSVLSATLRDSFQA